MLGVNFYGVIADGSGLAPTAKGFNKESFMNYARKTLVSAAHAALFQIHKLW